MAALQHPHLAVSHQPQQQCHLEAALPQQRRHSAAVELQQADSALWHSSLQQADSALWHSRLPLVEVEASEEQRPQAPSEVQLLRAHSAAVAAGLEAAQCGGIADDERIT